MTTDGERLFDLITVHCFACPHVVERADPIEAHDAMEEHYRDVHAKLIASLV